MSSSAENRAASGRTVRHSALNAPPAHGVFNAVASKNVFLAWSDAPRRACATEPFRADLYNNKSCSAALRRQSGAEQPVRTEFGAEQPVKTECAAERPVRTDFEAQNPENHQNPPNSTNFPAFSTFLPLSEPQESPHRLSSPDISKISGIPGLAGRGKWSWQQGEIGDFRVSRKLVRRVLRSLESDLVGIQGGASSFRQFSASSYP